MTTDAMIEIKLTTTNVFTRWPCHVCGGCTEKVEVLAESDGAKDGSIRVCERCLEAGNIDERLAKHADDIDAWAAQVRALIGRLKVPTFAEWKAYSERAEVARYAMCTAAAEGVYDQVLTDDAVFAEWLPKYQQDRRKLFDQSGRPLDGDFPF